MSLPFSKPGKQRSHKTEPNTNAGAWCPLVDTYITASQVQGGVAVLVSQTEVGTGAGQQHLCTRQNTEHV